MIHTLHAKGYSIRGIAKIVGLDRRTVSRRLKQAELTPYKPKKYQSILDPYKDYINKRLKQALPDYIPAPVILREITEYGYTGSLRRLQEYIKSIKDTTTCKDPIVRFETKPGKQAQVDWTVIRSGKSPIYGFVMVLGYSRYSFTYFTDNMTQNTWQDCHTKAFEYFGGIPQTILYDNLKSVVIERDKYGKDNHSFNHDFLTFSKAKFIPRLCQPYRAQTKGKVERFNHYLKSNFYVPLKSSLKGSGIVVNHQLLNNHIFAWLEHANSRIHATTSKRPKDRIKSELAYLSPLYASAKPTTNRSSDSADKTKSNSTTSSKTKSSVTTIPKIDINYQTKLSDYESILGGVYATH